MNDKPVSYVTALDLADMMQEYGESGFQYPLCMELKYVAVMLRQQQAEIEELKDIVLRFVDLSWGDGFKKYLNEADSLEENKLRDNVFAILRKASEK